MNSKIIVFTSPTCPHCPSAVSLAKEVEKERDDVKVEEVSTATGKGSKLAKHYGVMSVPTVFVRGPAYHQNIGLRGTPRKEALAKAVDISLGLAEWEEEKGFGKKIKSFVKEKLGIKIKT